MPDGKPAGVRCVQLDDQNLCKLFNDPHRPTLCRQFDYDEAVCGESREEALVILTQWEHATA
ncbi:hypothetical protein GCM10009038_05170 [Salinicola rhizosphaerae]|uniref:YkgJ family cysteine cluster protein n=2 Tax=Salinicola rhizosphaerae TaxID=1443141 RepID=A0ABQ3DS06_9GAMM|nr:hypothetical protein GCM10009038_05170 [Salinicola rhizosphaerae]